MRRGVALVIVLGIVSAVIYGFIASQPSDGVSESELAGRVARARPDWSNFTEDLKGYLGATPVARWKGVPREARVEGNMVRIRFAIDPPWSGYAFGMPILLRDPLGHVHLNRDYERGDGNGTYTFVLNELDPDVALPWVEIKYPSEHQKRLVFSGDGTWRAGDVN